MADGDFVYVVTRDGRRVTHTNHPTKDDALKESAYWTKVIHTVLSNGQKADPRSVIRIVRTDKPNRIR